MLAWKNNINIAITNLGSAPPSTISLVYSHRASKFVILQYTFELLYPTGHIYSYKMKRDWKEKEMRGEMKSEEIKG